MYKSVSKFMQKTGIHPPQKSKTDKKRNSAIPKRKRKGTPYHSSKLKYLKKQRKKIESKTFSF